MNRRAWLKTSACWSAVALLNAACAPLDTRFQTASSLGGAGLAPVPALPPGGTIALIAPSGQAAAQVDQSAAWLRTRGYRPRVFPGAREATPYLAGDDAARLRDLHDAFADPGVDAIICLRGGYGAMRLLDHLDFALLRANPKPLVGYSDITALHLAINRYAGFVTFHGPMLASDLLAGKQAPTEAALFAMLQGQLGRGALLQQPSAYGLSALRPGIASGRLTGGNLSMICATLATPYAIETRDTILFIEDVSEPPYRIDRMLTQLRLAGKLDGIRGVLLGEFTEMGTEDGTALNETVLQPLFEEIFGPLRIPVLSGWRSGHGDPNLTLPMGAAITLDADARQLRLAQDVVLRRSA